MKHFYIPIGLAGNIPESVIQWLAGDAVQQKRLLSRCPVALDESAI